MPSAARRPSLRPRAAAVAIAGLALLLAGCGGSRGPSAERPRRTRGEVTDRDIRNQSVGQLEELLPGRFPGVQVLQVPGGGLSIRIRGATSVYGSNQPLYVVDGMPVQVGPEGLVGLNPGDIQRIEVLRDIGQIAEYGVMGANGVVRITTKKAR